MRRNRPQSTRLAASRGGVREGPAKMEHRLRSPLWNDDASPAAVIIAARLGRPACLSLPGGGAQPVAYFLRDRE